MGDEVEAEEPPYKLSDALVADFKYVVVVVVVVVGSPGNLVILVAISD